MSDEATAWDRAREQHRTQLLEGARLVEAMLLLEAAGVPAPDAVYPRALHWANGFRVFADAEGMRFYAPGGETTEKATLIDSVTWFVGTFDASVE